MHGAVAIVIEIQVFIRQQIAGEPDKLRVEMFHLRILIKPGRSQDFAGHVFASTRKESNHERWFNPQQRMVKRSRSTPSRAASCL